MILPVKVAHRKYMATVKLDEELAIKFGFLSQTLEFLSELPPVALRALFEAWLSTDTWAVVFAWEQLRTGLIADWSITRSMAGFSALVVDTFPRTWLLTFRFTVLVAGVRAGSMRAGNWAFFVASIQQPQARNRSRMATESIIVDFIWARLMQVGGETFTTLAITGVPTLKNHGAFFLARTYIRRIATAQLVLVATSTVMNNKLLTALGTGFSTVFPALVSTWQFLVTGFSTWIIFLLLNLKTLPLQSVATRPLGTNRDSAFYLVLLMAFSMPLVTTW